MFSNENNSYPKMDVKRLVAVKVVFFTSLWTSFLCYLVYKLLFLDAKLSSIKQMYALLVTVVECLENVKKNTYFRTFALLDIISG